MSGVLDQVQVRGYDRSVCECCVQRGRLGGVLVCNSAGEPVEEDRFGWEIVLEEFQPKRRGG
jgi:hypothetical protein